MKMGTEFWVAHVAAARLESISAAKYARQNDISVAALYYWQSKLKANNQTPVAEPAGKFVALRVAGCCWVCCRVAFVPLRTCPTIRTATFDVVAA